MSSAGRNKESKVSQLKSMCWAYYKAGRSRLMRNNAKRQASKQRRVMGKKIIEEKLNK